MPKVRTRIVLDDIKEHSARKVAVFLAGVSLVLRAAPIRDSTQDFMSTQNEQKTYVKASVKEKVFPDGGSSLSVSFNADELKAILAKHTNSRGYLNLKISKRRDVGKFGETHAVVVDTWEPEQKPKGRY